MKKAAFIVAMVWALCGVAMAQDYVVPVETWDYEEINGSNYHGYAFHESERIIQKRLAYVNRYHVNQEGDCPVVDEHIRKYERQYVGFTDITGCHIVWVNFVWDENAAERLTQDIVLTEGGCGHYWHIKVNLSTGKLSAPEVNSYGDVKFIPRTKKPAHRISRPKRPQAPGKVRKTGIPHDPQEARF